MASVTTSRKSGKKQGGKEQRIVVVSGMGAEGDDIYQSYLNQYTIPEITPDKVYRYTTQNIHMKNNLVNLRAQVFPGEPTVEVVNPDDEVEEDATEWLRDLIYPLRMYESMQISFEECMYYGASVKSLGYENKDNQYAITEIRDLPAISFKTSPPKSLHGVPNGLMPGIYYDDQEQKVKVYQTNVNGGTTELENFYIIRDPTTPAPAGLAYCLPVYPVIAMIDMANQAANQQMARTGAPLIFPKIVDEQHMTSELKTWGEQFVKRWGKNTGFFLPPGVEFANANIHETNNAKLRLEALIGWVNAFFNPTSVLKREGQTLSSSDTAALQVWNNFIAGQQSWLEYAYEEMLNPLLEPNGYKGLYVRIRLQRPSIERSQIRLEHLKVGIAGKALTPELIYRNLQKELDLPDWNDEIAAQVQEQATAPAASNPFAAGGGGLFGAGEPMPIGNVQPLPPTKIERTPEYHSIDRDLAAAIEACKNKVVKEVRETYPYKKQE